MSIDTKEKNNTSYTGATAKQDPTQHSKSMHHAHDKAFKLSMSEVRVAREMIEAYLPANIVELIDTNKLIRANSSYIDAKFKATESDILYKTQIKTGQQCWLYFLWEHQSSYDTHIHLRLLSYTCRIMEEHVKQQGKHARLPIVLPSLVYNGTKTPYPGSCDLFDSFENPSLAKKLMFKPLNLIDLTIKTDEELLQHNWSAMMNMLLKHMRHPNFLDIQHKINHSITFLYEQDNGKLLAMSLLECIIRTTNMASKNEFIANIKKCLPQAGENIMTIYQQLTKEGMDLGVKKGMDLGRQQGMDLGVKKGIDLAKKTMVRNMFKNNMSIADIAQIIEAEPEEVIAIKARLESESIND